MSFSQLPLELVEHVLAYVVGDYTLFYSCTSTLSCRLVCKLFDHIVSQHVFRNLDYGFVYREDMKHETAVWLLRTKSTMGVKHHTVMMAGIRVNELEYMLWKLLREKDPSNSTVFLERRECQARISAGTYAVRAANQTRSDLWWDLYYSATPVPSPRLSSSSVEARDADSYLQDMKTRGPFSVAAYLGDVPLMQALLQAGADPNQKHSEFGLPLYAAAFAGRTDSLALLLDAGAHATDSQGPHGTPMEVAVKRGHEAAVRLLVDRKVDAGCALWDALKRKRLAIADLLLERGRVDVNTSRESGDKPIILALDKGYRCQALVLACRPELQPNHVNPPLIKAIYKKWYDVAEALMARPDIDLSATNFRGDTALHAACKCKDVDMVRLLLVRDNVAVNKLNDQGRTALRSALSLHQFDIAGLLLSHKDCNASAGRGIANSPLNKASVTGHYDTVARLLQRPEVRQAENFTRLAHNALGCALKHVNGRTFDLIHSTCPFIDLNGKDNDGVPFVHLAIGKRGYHERAKNSEILKMLLAAGDIDTNVLFEGKTPLMAMVSNHNVLDVAHTLAHEDTQFIASANAGDHEDEDEDEDEDTALPDAMKRSSVYAEMVEIMRTLLAHANTDPNLAVRERLTKRPHLYKDATFAPTTGCPYVLCSDYMPQDVGDSPLARAVYSKNYTAMRLLLAHDAINPNTTDSDGRTPLWMAVYSQRKRCESDKGAKAAQLLLAHATTDPNLADNFGWTPLLLAVFLGCGEEVEALLAHSAIDIHCPNRDGCTPLEMAEQCEFVEIKAQLLAWAETHK